MHDEDHAHHGERHDRPTPLAALLLPELKGQIVAECEVSGASVAGVALAHGINANIVHRGMREQADGQLPAPRNEFVALNLPPSVEQVPVTETSSPPVTRAIQVEVQCWTRSRR